MSQVDFQKQLLDVSFLDITMTSDGSLDKTVACMQTC